MSKYHGSIRLAIQDNETKPCAVKSCVKHRHQISQHCTTHRNSRWLWGHPEGHSILKHEFDNEVKEVSDIIRLNLDHEGIRYAINFLSSWMKAGSVGSEQVPCPDHLGRLYQAEVNPIDLFCYIAGLWLFADRNYGPGRRVKSDLHLDYVTGNRIIRFSPYPRSSTKGPDHRDVGQYVRKHVGVMLLNVINTAKKKEAQREALNVSQYSELKID